MDKKLIKEIKSWVKDFQKTYPENLQIDDDGHTFEGSAYSLFNLVLSENTKSLKQDKHTIKITVKGGVVTDVENLPDGWDYELHDYDN